MCIALFTTSHPGYKLILASNRDEFHDRPASFARWHDWDVQESSAGPGPDSGSGAGADGSVGSERQGGGEGHVLSGIDLSTEGGGTWLGMTRDMRVGVLTNIRPPNSSTPVPRPAGAPSRGALLRKFLSSTSSTISTSTSTASALASSRGSSSPPPDLSTFLNAQTDSHEYDGFNLLLFQPRSLFARSACSAPAETPLSTQPISPLSAPMQVGYLTNRPIPTGSRLVKQLPPGSHGLSNTVWDEPWPKVIQGSEGLDDILAEWEAGGENGRGGTEELVELLMGLLSRSINVRSPADAPHSIRIPTLSFGGRAYGTRTSTVVLITDDNEVTFVERTLGPREGDVGETGVTGGFREARAAQRGGLGEVRYVFKGETFGE